MTTGAFEMAVGTGFSAASYTLGWQRRRFARRLRRKRLAL
jgi:hypothetical protein